MIDMRTIVFSYIISNVVCTIVMAALWIRNRRHFAGLGFWVADFVMQLLGLLLAASRGILPDFVSIVMANTFVIAGVILLLTGLEQFAGKHPSQLHNYILLAVFIGAYIWFTFVQPSLLHRVVTFSLLVILLHAQGAWLMLRGVEPDLRPATRGIGYVFVTVCLIAFARLIADLIVNPGNDFFRSGIYDTLYILANQMLFIILTFSLFLMVNRRLVANLERDIAEHEQVATALHTSETLFRQMFTEHSAVKLLVDPVDGNIIDANPAAGQFYGYPIETLLQMNVSQINTMTSSEIESALQDARQHKRNYFVFQHRLASGELRDVEIYSTPIRVNERQLLYSIIHDITERKQADEELRRSEERFRQLITSAPDAIIGANQEGRIMFASAEATKLLGYELEELLGMDIETLVPTRFRAAHIAKYAVYMANPHPRPMRMGMELFAKRKDGNEVPVEISLSRMGTKAGVLVTAFIRDVTVRRQLDQALRNRTNVMEALNQVTLDLINRHEMDDILQTLLVKIGALLDASDISFDLVENEDTLVTYAVTSDQPLKKGDTMRRGEGGWLSWQAIDSGEPTVLEDYSTWPQRRSLYEGYPIHAIMIVPIQQRDRVIGAINISRNEANKPFNDTDVYAAKQLAQMVALVLDNAQLYAQLHSELVQSVRREGALHEAQAQVLEQHRAMATIDERQRMARDLHDSVNQSIHGLMLFSETLVSMLDRNNVERARQISERLQESARQALKETRLLLYQSQVSVEGRGVNLVEELNARLANVELRAGVRAQIIQEGSLEYCPEAWYENLFWITIEALNNSLKHAQARSVQISLRCFPKIVELEVSDDGRGFDTTKPGAGGYGLRNMRDRADLLGGRLTVTSTPAKGANVLFRAEIKESTWKT